MFDHLEGEPDGLKVRAASGATKDPHLLEMNEESENISASRRLRFALLVQDSVQGDRDDPEPPLVTRPFGHASQVNFSHRKSWAG